MMYNIILLKGVHSMNNNAVYECILDMKKKLEALEERRAKYTRALAFTTAIGIGSIFAAQNHFGHNPFQLDNKNLYQVEYLVDANGEKKQELGEFVDEYTELADIKQQIIYKTGWAEVYDKKGRYFRNIRIYEFQNLSYEDLKKLTENPYFLWRFHESKEIEPEYQNYVENTYKDEFIIRMPVDLKPDETNQTMLENLKDIFAFMGLSSIYIFLAQGFVYAYYYGEDPKKRHEEHSYIKCLQEEITMLENGIKRTKRKRK